MLIEKISKSPRTIDRATKSLKEKGFIEHIKADGKYYYSIKK